jgi:hypothetical protein
MAEMLCLTAEGKGSAARVCGRIGGSYHGGASMDKDGRNDVSIGRLLSALGVGWVKSKFRQVGVVMCIILTVAFSQVIVKPVLQLWFPQLDERDVFNITLVALLIGGYVLVLRWRA